MATTKEVQDQLNQYLKGEGREPSTEMGHAPIPLYPEPPESTGSDFEGLIHAESKGERIVSKTIRFHTFRELWRKLMRRGGDSK